MSEQQDSTANLDLDVINILDDGGLRIDISKFGDDVWMQIDVTTLPDRANTVVMSRDIAMRLRDTIDQLLGE